MSFLFFARLAAVATVSFAAYDPEQSALRALVRLLAQLYYAPDGHSAAGKLAPVLSVRLLDSLLREGLCTEPGRPTHETLYRIEPEQLSVAVGQRTAGLDRIWLELIIAEGGGIPRRTEF